MTVALFVSETLNCIDFRLSSSSVVVVFVWRLMIANFCMGELWFLPDLLVMLWIIEPN